MCPAWNGVPNTEMYGKDPKVGKIFTWILPGCGQAPRLSKGSVREKLDVHIER